MVSPLRALIRISVYLALTAILLPLQAFALKFSKSLSVRLPIFYHRCCAGLLGFQIRVSGKICAEGPVLFTCNHTSYSDIAILGSLLPASFVAKAEVANWPLFGLLAKLQRTVFVDRRASKATKQRDEMIRRLEAGENLILFPEGTSSDGNAVLPFKSALFSVAQVAPYGQPLLVQPVSLAYTLLDGMPVGRALRPYFAWYGDMMLAPHFWEVAGLGHATVDVVFHPPVSIQEYGSRKALADHCQAAVARGVSAANSGRLDGFPSASTS
ncbi:MAG: lysophospholipid acyltransferase family protein [Pseudomonadota bacterium]|nr:lysophospholipid acyltransferase family protein [Pseudomonadota bacterium]